MNELVKDFYARTYPTDDIVEDINSSITLQQVLNGLIKGNGDNFYELIGVSDSLVRERVFLGLSEVMDLEYEHIFKLWLNG